MRHVVTSVLFAMGACTYAEPADVVPLDGTRLTLTSGDAQTSTVGSTLVDPLVVTAIDVDGNPIADLTLELVVTNGAGNVPEPALRTDVQGRGRTSFTLGTVPGLNVLEFRTSGLGIEPVEFVANGRTGPATRITIVSGDNQSVISGAVLPDPLVVKVGDEFDNPVSGEPVMFSIASGNGHLANTEVSSNVDGLAGSELTVGTVAGANVINAQTGAILAAFHATGRVGQPSQLVKSPTASGDNQSAQVANPLPAPLVVAVQDANGNGVEGVAVQFVVTAGAGTISTPNAVTDSRGEVQTDLTLGPVVGTNLVEARVVGLLPAVFTSAGIGGQATKIQRVSGDNQTATVDRILVAPFTVRVLDALDNPVPGFLVPFVVVAGNGTVTSQATVTTNASGVAQATFKLGTQAGTNQVRANTTGLSGGPITFTASGTPDQPTKLVRDGTVPRATSGTALVVTAIVQDVFGNPVPNVAGITWNVGSGTANINPPIATSGGDGRVSTQITPTQMVDVVVNATKSGLSSASFAIDVRGYLPPITAGTIGSSVSRLRAMDVNRDGKPDLLIEHGSNGSSLSVAMNTTPTGAPIVTFGPLVLIASSSGGGSRSIADVNGDGKLDILVFELAPCTLCVRMLINQTPVGATAAAFTASPAIVANSNSVLSDANMDGRMDLVAPNGVHLGTGTGTFLAPTGPVFGEAFRASTELDGDNRPDLISDNAFFANTTVAGSMTPTYKRIAGSPTLSFGGLFVDLTGDGLSDLVDMEPSGPPRLTVRRNTSVPQSISFSAGTPLTLSAVPVLASGDVDRDGKPDIVRLQSAAPQGVTIMQTRPTLTFLQTTIPIGAFNLEVGDFNQDGAADIVLITNPNSTLTVLVAE